MNYTNRCINGQFIRKGQLEKECFYCNEIFKGLPSRINRRKYCSVKCSALGSIGHKGYWTGKTFSEQTKQKLRINNAKYWLGTGKSGNSGKFKPNVGRTALHDWVKAGKSKTSTCLLCKKVGKTQWANISWEYKRELKDYAELCRKCHYWYDHNWLDKKEFNVLR